MITIHFNLLEGEHSKGHDKAHYSYEVQPLLPTNSLKQQTNRVPPQAAPNIVAVAKKLLITPNVLGLYNKLRTSCITLSQMQLPLPSMPGSRTSNKNCLYG